MKHHHLIASLIASASVVGTAGGQVPENRVAELEARLKAVETQLERYQNTESQTIQKVLADAQSRSSLGAGKVGYSGGFFLADEKNTFQLKLNGILQTRYIYNHNDSDTADNDEAGFAIRRAELYLNGTLFKPELFFQFSGGFDRGTGNFGVISAYAGYQFSKEAEIRGGMFKAPFMAEELISAARQLAMERSLVNTYFSTGTTEGVQFQLSKNAYRLAVMAHDGTNAWSSEFSADKTDFAAAARLELKLAGEWSQFADFQGWDDSKPAIRVGLAVDYEAGETGDSADNPDFFKYSADLTAKGKGWGLFLAAAGKIQQGDGASDDLCQLGLLAQGGVFVIPNRAEVFLRYEYLDLDGVFSATTPIDHDLHLGTAGLNWYFFGHNAKLVTDVVYVCDGLPVGSTGLGLLASDGAQIAFRAAFHLSF